MGADEGAGSGLGACAVVGAHGLGEVEGDGVEGGVGVAAECVVDLGGDGGAGVVADVHQVEVAAVGGAQAIDVEAAGGDAAGGVEANVGEFAGELGASGLKSREVAG